MAPVRPWVCTLPSVGLTWPPLGPQGCGEGLSPGSAALALFSRMGNGENLPPGTVVKAGCVSASCDSAHCSVGFGAQTLDRMESQAKLGEVGVSHHVVWNRRLHGSDAGARR